MNTFYSVNENFDITLNAPHPMTLLANKEKNKQVDGQVEPCSYNSPDDGLNLPRDKAELDTRSLALDLEETTHNCMLAHPARKSSTKRNGISWKANMKRF